MPTTIKAGNTTLEVSDHLQKMVRNLLDKIAPNIEQILKNDLSVIMQKSKENWLVRRYRTPDGSFVSKHTKNSADMFNLKISIVSKNGGLGIRGAIQNTAPYAYAIRKGVDSINPGGGLSDLQDNAHLWTEVVRKPFEEAIEHINLKIITEITKLQS